MTVNIAGLNKAEVVAALYNAAKPQGLGFFQYDAKPMTAEQGGQYVGQYLDYLNGRVMKLKIEGDEFRENLYDRDNGQGEAQRVIDTLRKTNNPANADIQKMHDAGVLMSISAIREALDEPTTVTKGNNVLSVNLGADEVADPLRDKLNDTLTDYSRRTQKR